MTRVAIHGAAGRMGRNLVAACLDDPELELAAALVRAGDPGAGTDAGRLIGRDPAGVELSAEPAHGRIDVVVDFTRPEATLALTRYCQGHGLPLVVGTTGFSSEQQGELAAAAGGIPLLVAPNTSVGVNLVCSLVETAAAALGDDYDAEIVEAHHRHKVDAPSGTALRLGEIVARARGRELGDCAAYARRGRTGERARGEIGFATVRGGDIVGEHTVVLAGDGERIEITHRAATRMLFARGAMRAAAWLAGREPGLYDMQDVLGLGGRST